MSDDEVYDENGDIDGNRADVVEDDDDEVDANTVEDVEDTEDDETEDEDDAVDDGELPAANAQVVLAYLAKAVVAYPDEVSIDVSDGRRGGLSLNVQVADGDMGRVIGKRGRVAQSIRTIVRAAAVQDGVSVDVEFVD